MSKTTVIYHSADYDGIFCREIARKFLPEAELIGWDYGDEVPQVDPECDLVILDLSIESLMSHPKLIWIDHHKTSIEKYAKLFENQMFRVAYVIDGVAACRLSWQFFTGFQAIGEVAGLPQKQDYVDRKVLEPIAVRLAGEYDIWDHRGDGDLEFQFGLGSLELGTFEWSRLLSLNEKPSMDEVEKRVASGENSFLEPDGTCKPDIVSTLLRNGTLLMAYQKRSDENLMLHRSFVFEWEGLKFLTLNTAKCNSQTFAARDYEQTGHDALMAFFFNGRVWKFSMYHAAHRTDIHLSAIAAKYGGGGHKGACGFETISPGGIGLDLDKICDGNGHLVRKPCGSSVVGS